MVKADDAPKISRVIERFKFATVDKARIESEIVADKAARAAGAEQKSPVPDEKTIDDVPKTSKTPDVPDIGDTEKLLDDLLGTKEGKAAPETPKLEKPEPQKTVPEKNGKGQPDSPPLARGGQEPPSENPSAPTSDSKKKPEKTTSSRPSVKDEIRELKAARKKDEPAKRDERAAAEKPKLAPATTAHQQPQQGKSKSKKSRGSR
jgi:hypothetical protein